jgi:WD40 repeat protein
VGTLIREISAFGGKGGRTMPTYNPNRPKYWTFLVIAMILLLTLIAMAGCSDDDEETSADEPVPTATPELEVPFRPERLFSVQLTDEDQVYDLAIHPEGGIAAVGSYLTVYMVDIDDGTVMREIEHRHSVDDVAFSPDGSTLAAGQGVYGVQLSDTNDGSMITELHGGYNNVVAFHPSEELIATGNRTGAVWIWEIETGEQLNEFTTGDGEWLMSLAFSPDGTTVAAGHWDGTVHLWDVETGELQTTLENPEGFGYAHDIEFSPDGAFLAVAGARDENRDVVRIWNVAEAKTETTLETHRESRSVEYTTNGDRISIANQHGVTIINVDDAEAVIDIPVDQGAGGDDEVNVARFAKDDTHVIVGYKSGIIELWRITE